ncbi:hypothetical protein [uncultured Mediterranean phage uvMED]|nr:hypothetical protein [uncultured Mediterranean phage uvMED]
MDIPSLFMIPSAVSSGKVHSVFPNSTDADFDFNRDSDATRVNSEGLIERVGYYGSDLVTDGDFSSSSNWYIGTGCSISNGQAIFSSASGGSGFTGQNANANICTIGKTYKVTFTIVSISEGGLKIRFPFNSSNIHTEAGTYTEYGVSTNANIYIQNSGTTTAVIDNLSVVEVLGDRARLNYEIEGGLVNTKPSLLLEPQSTNLIPYSEDFSNSAWTKNNVTVTSGFASPDGTNSAYLMTDDATDSKHGVYDVDILSQDGNIYTRSVFVKKGTARYVVLSARHIPTSSGTSWIYDFDSNNWVLTGSSGAGQSIKNYANGWVRLSVSHISNSNFNNDFSIGISSGATVSDASYSGSGDTLYIWGAQIEQLSYATSYIPTNGSTQTRAAETCNGAGTSSILPSEGILYTEISVNGLPSSGFLILGLNDGTVNNNVFIEIGTNGLLTFFVISGGTNVASKVSSVNPLNNFVKCAIRYKLNDVSFWINGTEIHSDTSATMPVGLSQLDFDYGNGAHKFYGNVRDIRVYNTKEMTDSEVDILLTKITS